MLGFLFNLAVRLFLAFLVAKLLLGGGNPAMLLGLALGLVGLTYLIAWLERLYQRSWQSKAMELGWRLARFFIGLNQVEKQRPANTRKAR
jgi:hypothetical protein